MSGISFPALAIRPPEQADLLGQAAKAEQLQNAQQQNQAGQLEIQQRQQALKDQQAMTQAMLNWDPSQGYDALAHSVLKNGGSANAATAIQQHGFEVRKTASDIAKTDEEAGTKHLENLAKRHDLLLGSLNAVAQGPDDGLGQRLVDATQQAQKDGLIDPAHAQQVAQFSQLPPNQLRPALAVLEKSLRGESVQFEQTIKAQQLKTSAAEQAKAEAETKTIQAESDYYSKLGLAPGVTPEMAAYSAYLQKGGKPEGWAAFKAKTEAAATQPFKIQTAQVEAQTRMAMEGMAKPVYAFNPQTNSKDLMSQSEAIARGIKVMTPVTGKEVSDDTMLINRLGDVHQKIAEYQQALQKPIDAKDQGNLAALLGTQGVKLGAFGTEIPMDRVNAALSKENLSGLSANARDQLVAYRNAREALTGYTRVLSGSGRSSDKTLELQEQTLPIPSITDPDFSKRSLDAFRQNLQVVGQGLPNIPGIKSPEQWEQEITNQGRPTSQKMSRGSQMLTLGTLLQGLK